MAKNEHKNKIVQLKQENIELTQVLAKNKNNKSRSTLNDVKQSPSKKVVGVKELERECLKEKMKGVM